MALIQARGKTYSFYVTAFNDFGESDPSNTVGSTIPGFIPTENPKGEVVIIIPGPVTIQIGQ